MEYRLEMFNQFVLATITEIENRKHDENILAAIKERCSTEKFALKNYLLQRAQDVSNEMELEIFVQQCMAEIIEMLNHLTSISESMPSDKKAEIEVLIAELKEVLNYIENRYSKYINLNERVPQCYVVVLCTELIKYNKTIKRLLQAKALDEELIEAIQQPLKKISKHKFYTYRELIYLKKLYSGLNEVITKTNQDLHASVIQYLLYMNFNSYLFITYAINFISKEVNGVEDSLERMEKLAVLLKKINQAHTKPDAALKEKVISVKEQVANWIAEELQYLEKKQRLFTVATKVKEDVVITDEEKINVSVSVDVLTLLVRAAKDSKLILNQQMTTMFKSVSRFCRTVNASNPSAQSMLRKSYVAERSAKRNAIAILQEMIKHINRY